MKTSDLVRIERKLDLIIDAFGLSSAHRLSPVEVTDTAQKILLQFQDVLLRLWSLFERRSAINAL